MPLLLITELDDWSIPRSKTSIGIVMKVTVWPPNHNLPANHVPNWWELDMYNDDGDDYGDDRTRRNGRMKPHMVSSKWFYLMTIKPDQPKSAPGQW